MVLGEWGTENHIKKQNEELEQLKQKTTELEEKAAVLGKKAAGLEQKAGELEQENIELKKGRTAENELARKLLDAGRVGELKIMLADEAYRQKLLEQYHLTSGNEK